MDFTSWGVHSDPCGSDHFPILISASTVTNDQFPPNWRYNYADWPSFTNLCSSVITDDILDDDDPILSLTDKIINVFVIILFLYLFFKQKQV